MGEDFSDCKSLDYFVLDCKSKTAGISFAAGGEEYLDTIEQSYGQRNFLFLMLENPNFSVRAGNLYTETMGLLGDYGFIPATRRRQI